MTILDEKTETILDGKTETILDKKTGSKNGGISNHKKDCQCCVCKVIRSKHKTDVIPTHAGFGNFTDTRV